MSLLHVVGARPNFMKVGPVHRALAACGATQRLVHTGQHFDANMSAVFFDELGLPEPDINLEVGAGTHAQQTGQVMIRLDEVLRAKPPDWLLVYGDVNSCLAAALVAAKRGVRIAHVEAGLRSFDRSMPEEINRIVTDQLADLLLTPSPDGDANLAREGVARDKIRRVGNVMVDTLVHLLPRARTRWGTPPLAPWHDRRYVLTTLHRPSNVDEAGMLRRIMETLSDIAAAAPVLFPVHPRTRRQLEAAGLSARAGSGLHLLDPLGYLDFLALEERAAVVVTDSGGVQEETTYLGVPCFTLRANTERPVTVTLGTNTLVGADLDGLTAEVQAALAGRGKRGQPVPLWDGRAGERIARILAGVDGDRVDEDSVEAQRTYS